MKVVVDSLEEVPESLRDEYEEKDDGTYALKLEGDVPGYVSSREYGDTKFKLKKFRDNYTNLMKRAAELADVEQMPEDLGPLQNMIDSLQAKIEELENRGTDDPNKVQEQIQKAIKPMQEKLDRAEKELKSAKEEREAAQTRVNRSLLRETVGSELSKVGVRSNALDFLLSNAEGDFEVRDDQVMPREGVLSEDNPGEPITVDEWVKLATKKYDFAFEKSDGGDLPTDGGPGGSRQRAPKPGVRQIKSSQLSDDDLGRLGPELREGKVQIVNG